MYMYVCTEIVMPTHALPYCLTMAIDFLILAVLLLSFTINLLALLAFWVTPSLRSTANRFTINLLIINLVGCVILAPTLFLSGSAVGDADSESGANDNSLTTGSSQSGLNFLTANANDDSIEFYSKAGNHQMTIRHNGKLVEQDGIILRKNVTQTEEENDKSNNDPPHTIETIYKCNATYCRELTIDENSDTLVITEIEEEGKIQVPADDQRQETDEVERLALPLLTMRSWAIDMAAALGAMGVLLVVGDTWCAVTDPLRYHSRISGVKSWVFIVITWAVGIMFGAMSALRAIDFESETIISKQKSFTDSTTKTATHFSFNSANNIFSTVFSCLYFLIIILLPFGFICGMYWRIFSEARGNGLRMRQNGSSPLLQSALNLTHASQQGNQQYSNSLCVHRNSISSTSSQCGGLQMQIDSNQKRGSPSCLRRDSAAKVLLPPISDDGMSDEADNSSKNDELLVMPADANTQQQQQQQNIILTLQTASGEIKRNYSTRQLELLATSSQDLCGNARQGIRQVHSTPNLQRSVTLPQPLNENTCSPQLLGGHLPQNLPSIHLNRHSFQQNPNNNRSAHQNHQHLHHHQSLQIPTIQASPIALSYMSSLRHRLSNASSLFKYRDESRAACISILVVIVFGISYVSFGVLVLLQSRLPSANFEISSQLAILMILLPNLSYPFIFAYRNKRVRRGVKSLVCLEAWCRDSQLRRQGSSSCRFNSSSKYANSNLKRNSSRVSTYSTQSARFLTTQNSLVSNGTNSVAACFLNNNNNNCPAVPLRPNSSCSTIINFTLNKNQLNFETTSVETDAARTQHTLNKPRPVLQRGITIIEQVPLNGNAGSIISRNSSSGISIPKIPIKQKLYDLFFKSSKNLSCAAAQSCAQSTLDAEPTEV